MTFEQSLKGGREIAMQVSGRAFQTKGTASSLLESSEGSEAGRLSRRLLQDNNGHKSPESVGMERLGSKIARTWHLLACGRYIAPSVILF